MDDEIIIGIDVKNNSNKKKKVKKKSQKPKNKKENNPKQKKSRSGKKIGIILLFIILVVIILGSSLFNIKKIEVTGNSRISNEMVISLSGLELYKNIFTFNKLSVIGKIKRKLPDTVKITVQEKTPRYIIQIADSYAYINNQGYILEISTEKENMPILTGITTDLSNIKEGERLSVEDLKKMDMVIKICEIAKSNDLKDLITKIDIKDDRN